MVVDKKTDLFARCHAFPNKIIETECGLYSFIDGEFHYGIPSCKDMIARGMPMHFFDKNMHGWCKIIEQSVRI